MASGRGQISQSDMRVHTGLAYEVDRVDTLLTIDQATGMVRYPK